MIPFKPAIDSPIRAGSVIDSTDGPALALWGRAGLAPGSLRWRENFFGDDARGSCAARGAGHGVDPIPPALRAGRDHRDPVERRRVSLRRDQRLLPRSPPP